MARYRKVDSRIWNDEKFVALSDDGQLLFLFLLTHPHQTALGAMRGSLPGLASEKGWLTERLSEAFAEALSKGMVRRDEKASCIWLPNFLKYNRPENPNVVKAWGSSADLIPECSLKILCIQSAKDFLKAFKEPFREAFAEVFGECLPKEYAKSGAGSGAGTGAVLFKSESVSADGNERQLRDDPAPTDPPVGSKLAPRPPGDFRERFLRMRDVYPKGIYREAEWLPAERLVLQLLEGGATWDELSAGVGRYAAQSQARKNLGTQFVLSPVKFFDTVRPLFGEPFPIPATPAETVREQARQREADELERLKSGRAIRGLGGFRDPWPHENSGAYETALRLAERDLAPAGVSRDLASVGDLVRAKTVKA